MKLVVRDKIKKIVAIPLKFCSLTAAGFLAVVFLGLANMAAKISYGGLRPWYLDPTTILAVLYFYLVCLMVYVFYKISMDIVNTIYDGLFEKEESTTEAD